MTEAFLHYIWQQKLFMAYEQTTVDGLTVEVIDVGRLNTDAGADFFNAKIKIGATLWVGNVEIHTVASDWDKHGHAHDKAYNNVILHVVARSDKQVCKASGEVVAQCELQYPASYATKYADLCAVRNPIACADKLSRVPQLFVSAWKDCLLTERLEQKIEVIESLLAANENHWEEAFYVMLARNFGFHVNGLAFELLAKSLPLHCLAKHKDDLFQVEALLFGQSGLLQDEKDEYALRLRREYEYMARKFSLTPIDGSVWKMLRLRPGNFPHVRIAEFAALIHQSQRLFSLIVENVVYDVLIKLFRVQTSVYWDVHCTFIELSPEYKKRIGKDSVDIILINTVVPFVFAFAKHHADYELQEKALNLLCEIKAEKNRVVDRWRQLGMSVENAYDTQALLQLSKHYCDHKRCLQCRIGHKILHIKE